MLPLLLGRLRGRLHLQRRWYDAHAGTVPRILANKNANSHCPRPMKAFGKPLPPRTFRTRDLEKVFLASASRQLAVARLRPSARRQSKVFSQTKLLPPSPQSKKYNERTVPDISRVTPPGRVCQILNVNLAVSSIWTEVYST